jgi:hypothetical protein
MSIHKLAVIENSITMAAIAAIVLGLYAMGAGGWAGCGFLLLLNLSSYSEKRTVQSPAHHQVTKDTEASQSK